MLRRNNRLLLLGCLLWLWAVGSSSGPVACCCGCVLVGGVAGLLLASRGVWWGLVPYWACTVGGAPCRSWYRGRGPGTDVGETALLDDGPPVAVLWPVKPVLDLVPRQMLGFLPAALHKRSLDLAFPGFVSRALGPLPCCRVCAGGARPVTPDPVDRGQPPSNNTSPPQPSGTNQ